MKEDQYDMIAEQYSEAPDDVKKYVMTETFERMAGSVKGKSVLDLACGSGFFTRLLAKQSPREIVGVDISREMIRIAKDIDEKQPLGIKYVQEDVGKLELGRSFDIVTAVFLLNYSRTMEELHRMCSGIIRHLDDGGRFCTITLNPHQRPRKEIEYGIRHSPVSGRDCFEEGDQVRVELMPKGRPVIEFMCYFWSKQTYDECLERAGFNHVRWMDAVVSREGIERFGEDYWKGFLENPCFIGIVCAR